MSDFTPFSKRLKIELADQIQLTSMSSELRVSLYNLYYNFFRMECSPTGKLKDLQYYFYSKIWSDLLLQPLDEYQTVGLTNDSYVKHLFSRNEWYSVYNFYEHLFYLIITSDYCERVDVKLWEIQVNKTLRRNNSGYSFNDYHFIPIINSEELGELNTLATHTLQYQLTEVKIHLDQAVKLMSLKPEPDYRNSIKESISMVGTIARTIEPSNDLGKALHALERDNKINKVLASSFKTLYNYTSGKNGIRHELMDEVRLDLETTRFFLISCSAFANYLIEKGIKSGKFTSL